jgi:hypothetical protein
MAEVVHVSPAIQTFHAERAAAAAAALSASAAAARASAGAAAALGGGGTAPRPHTASAAAASTSGRLNQVMKLRSHHHSAARGAAPGGTQQQQQLQYNGEPKHRIHDPELIVDEIKKAEKWCTPCRGESACTSRLLSVPLMFYCFRFEF